jgi:hypothetical protein
MTVEGSQAVPRRHDVLVILLQSELVCASHTRTQDIQHSRVLAKSDYDCQWRAISAPQPP